MKTELKKGEAYLPSYYARCKGVHPSRITHLRDKLRKRTVGERWLVIHCDENDKYFSNPAHNRGGEK